MATEYASEHQNCEWSLPTSNGSLTWQAVEICLLCDIRQELRRIRSIAECPNAIAIPRILRRLLYELKRSKKKQPKPNKRKKRK
jgi:hypothetical protein